jgi:hypothetical protein
MTAEEHVTQLAEQLAAQSQSRARHLRAELLEAERKVSEIKAKLDAANLALKHLPSFQPMINGQFQCPRCWLDHELRSSLENKPGRHRVDPYDCSTCHFGMEVSY